MDSGKTTAGNTAAVREALELAAQALPFTVLTHIGGMPIGDVIDKVDAALAEPPRNCDRPECRSQTDAQKVWKREDGGRTAYYEWLLAPAEQKGESNGSR